ncbi:hypothetical protein [Biostraticola tofi]|uniref:Uncharacterized protein n=1 Tax=Biostraticola tofi TaxID=466109 RepID=A0A4R3Z5B0_9GAMM|nr:hypothetical protein [Biostraticola tofi]TCW00427.1 hypothetical protein EDC52_101777 [Biostraticola tofi]
MNEKPDMISLKERIGFVQKKVETLSALKDQSFADRLLFRSMDSHLSDLRAQQREIDNRHPLMDFMEIRLKGDLVDIGTIPLEILSLISGNLAGLVQKATHRISSGKDSQRVPNDLRNSLNMRLADLTPGSTRLGVTFSTGSGDLFDTVSSQAMKEIFSMLEASDEETFMAKVAEIGSNSTYSLKKIVDECEKNSLNFDMTWMGPLSGGRRTISLSSQEIHKLTSRLSLTQISKPWDESFSGELSLLSMYGKLEIVNKKERIKASYPIEMLTEIQKNHKVGEHVSVVASVTEIHNDKLGIMRRNYMIKSLK